MANLTEMETRACALSAIIHIEAQIEQLKRRERELVRAARAEGCTWKQIGEALGVSKQAVWERFGA